MRAIEEKQKMDSTRWANVQPNEELSWRSRTRDDSKEETTASKEEEDEEEEEEEEEEVAVVVEGDSGGRSTGDGNERSDVWRPGGGQCFYHTTVLGVHLNIPKKMHIAFSVFSWEKQTAK